ncbi:methyltransferase BTM2 [Biomphalaria pfeifferi]|uniref:Methyltransferase BTM2 n=1 Tax=Biomphalaria pfeifferi TaxID=112525 RepID=A0AAD8FHC1_BIOPF|nr:methyltransferase BTM2 [Biomphalaria pfeifferi]
MEAEGELSSEQAKKEHEQLASVIKGVHKHLRRNFRSKNAEIETLWQQHTQDEAKLQMYANAMYQLATQHWSKHADTRIDWCHRIAVDYFLHDGLKAVLEKDKKRKYYMDLRAQAKDDDLKLCDTLNVDKSSDRVQSVDQLLTNCKEACCNVQVATAKYGLPKHYTYLAIYRADDIKYGTVLVLKLVEMKREATCLRVLPVVKKIRLLDVGSCYNPFLGLEHFETVGVDLVPAQQTVLKCDFLQLTIHSLPPSIDALTYDLKNLASPVNQLPKASFHVVVFSLLLEYFPSPVQSQHRNAPMMKSWRLALEKLGFLRWKYEKMEHIHCIAFRKVYEDPSWESLSDSAVNQFAQMLYIPQDLTDACYDDLPQENNIADHDPHEFLSSACELPFHD